MTAFMTKVRDHMVSPVRVLRETDSLTVAEQDLSKLEISAMPVVDHAGCMVGVLSRTDLLRAGRVRVVMNGHRRRVLTLPSAKTSEFMTSTVEIVTAETTLSEAARRMVRRHIHRLYVSDDRRPTGVLSTKEMLQVVIHARLAPPIAELMHASLVAVGPEAPLSLAIDRMALTQHSGLVIAEDGWPVGILTQADALAARDAPPDDRVDHWMDPGVLCLPLAMPAFRAAEQIVATRARRILAVDGQRVRGILTGIDFARLVHGSAPR